MKFARATGQLWKYRVWQVATVAAVMISVAFFSLWRGNPAQLPENLTMALYFPICIFWFAWWAAAIRCPACGVRPAWYQMRRGHAQDVVDRISASNVCPACGHDPAAQISRFGGTLDEHRPIQ
jgi:hypothetical protein